MIRLTVNGQTHEAQPGITVRGLVDQLGLDKQAVAVEVNRQVVPRRMHEQATLHDGDVVELVTLVGGG